MTKQKTFKRRVRERMAKTGESYASAREALIGAEPAGIHPETSALRFALADAGIEISEALTLHHRRRRGRRVHVLPLRQGGLHPPAPVGLEPVPERHPRRRASGCA